MAPSSQSKLAGANDNLVLTLIIILLAGAVLVWLLGGEGSPTSTGAAANSRASGSSDGPLREGVAARTLQAHNPRDFH